MERFFAYWKRGWWAWLLYACFQAVALAVTWPIARGLADRDGLRWLALSVVVVFPAPAFLGWLFERFAGASARLAQPAKRFAAGDGEAER